MLKNKNVLILGYCGVLGTILLSIADIVFSEIGSLDVKLGTSKLIPYYWDDISSWKFTLFFNLFIISIPLIILGITSTFFEIRKSNSKLSKLFGVFAVIGFFSVLVLLLYGWLLPLTYFALGKDVELTEKFIEYFVSNLNQIFLYISMLLFIVGTSVVSIIFILKNKLNKLTLLCNPLFFMILLFLVFLLVYGPVESILNSIFSGLLLASFSLQSIILNLRTKESVDLTTSISLLSF